MISAWKHLSSVFHCPRGSGPFQLEPTQGKHASSIICPLVYTKRIQIPAES